MSLLKLPALNGLSAKMARRAACTLASMLTPVATTPVVVVAESKETASGLQEYLATVGVACRASSELGMAEGLDGSVNAVVLFPDEFQPASVIRWINALRAGRTNLLLIVVTSAPQRLAQALEPVAQATAPVVIAKPVFGWAILDALRLHWRRLP